MVTHPLCLSQCDSVFQWPQEKPCPKAWASLERVIEIQSKKNTHTHPHTVHIPSDEEKLQHVSILSPCVSLSLSLKVNTGLVSRVCLRRVATRYWMVPRGLRANRRTRQKRSAPWPPLLWMSSSKPPFLTTRKPAGQQRRVIASHHD